MNNTATNNAPVHGEISWNDNQYGNNKEGAKSSKDTFLRLNDGSNVIRIVTNPFQYLTHQGVKKVGDMGPGRKMNCSKPLGSCPLCDAGHPVNMRWFFGVIDRRTDSYRVLDASPMVYYAILGYNKKTDVWGDPTKYDFDIVKNSKNPQSYYTVQPIPHKPLTPADQKKRDDADLNELRRFSAPMELDLMQKLLAKHIGDGELYIPPAKEKDGTVKAKSTGATLPSVTASKVVAPKVTLEEDDTEFPPFEG